MNLVCRENLKSHISQNFQNLSTHWDIIQLLHSSAPLLSSV